MTRAKERDEFGCDVEYKIPDSKRCPVCRREVEQIEIDYVKGCLKKHPEVGKL